VVIGVEGYPFSAISTVILSSVYDNVNPVASAPSFAYDVQNAGCEY